jgi:hypothetical protein
MELVVPAGNPKVQMYQRTIKEIDIAYGQFERPGVHLAKLDILLVSGGASTWIWTILVRSVTVQG